MHKGTKYATYEQYVKATTARYLDKLDVEYHGDIPDHVPKEPPLATEAEFEADRAPAPSAPAEDKAPQRYVSESKTTSFQGDVSQYWRRRANRELALAYDTACYEAAQEALKASHESAVKFMLLLQPAAGLVTKNLAAKLRYKEPTYPLEIKGEAHMSMDQFQEAMEQNPTGKIVFDLDVAEPDEAAMMTEIKALLKVQLERCGFFLIDFGRGVYFDENQPPFEGPVMVRHDAVKQLQVELRRQGMIRLSRQEIVEFDLERSIQLKRHHLASSGSVMIGHNKFDGPIAEERWSRQETAKRKRLATYKLPKTIVTVTPHKLLDREEADLARRAARNVINVNDLRGYETAKPVCALVDRRAAELELKIYVKVRDRRLMELGVHDTYDEASDLAHSIKSGRVYELKAQSVELLGSSAGMDIESYLRHEKNAFDIEVHLRDLVAETARGIQLAEYTRKRNQQLRG